LRRLIIRPGAIGDTILAFPALRRLCAEYTEIWVRSDIVPLIDFADRVRAISSTGIDLLGLADVVPPKQLIQELGSFDEVVTWYGANRSEFREELQRIARSVRFLGALPPDGAGKHAADYFLEQAGGAGTAAPRIEVATAPAAAGHVVLHPFSGGARKNWPFPRFEALAKQLTTLGYRVEWAACPDRVRFENLRDLAEWLAGARCFVGNDSGITHLAAAVGVPVVALFGPTDPAVWAPRGRVVQIIRKDPIDLISVADVVSELRVLRR
jgi:hypothetical protein